MGPDGGGARCEVSSAASDPTVVRRARLPKSEIERCFSAPVLTIENDAGSSGIHSLIVSASDKAVNSDTYLPGAYVHQALV